MLLLILARHQYYTHILCFVGDTISPYQLDLDDLDAYLGLLGSDGRSYSPMQLGGSLLVVGDSL